jgi:hypothetical protein
VPLVDLRPFTEEARAAFLVEAIADYADQQVRDAAVVSSRMTRGVTFPN